MLKSITHTHIHIYKTILQIKICYYADVSSHANQSQRIYANVTIKKSKRNLRIAEFPAIL